VSREDWSVERRMHITPPSIRSFHEIALAEDALGAREPLVAILERYASAVAQLSVTLVVTLASALVLIADQPAALPVLIGGGIAALSFALRVAMTAIDRRDGVLQLIVAGRSAVPIPAVRRELARLLDPARRASLARSYEAVGEPPGRSGRVPDRGWVLTAPSVVAEVRPELLRIARLLRGERAPARGVAAAERLLCGPASSLFGRDVETLRQDLRRIGFLLDG
jgi:hypothetical protein